MKKQNEWVCSHNCPPRKEPCEHLEALLPPVDAEKHVITDYSQASLDVFQVYYPKFSLPEFEEKMRSFGFVEEWDLDLLTARYYYGQSLRQIEHEFSYMSYQTVKRRLKKLHTLLLERGYPRKEE